MLAKNLTTRKSGYRNRGKTLYGSKNYENPFFRQRKTRIRWDSKRIVLASVFFVSISFSLFITYSNYLKISSIEISGLRDLSQAEIQQAVWTELDKGEFSLYPKRNLLLLSSKSLESFLSNAYSLQDISVSKDYPSRLIINLQERVPAAVWLEGDKYYFIDDSGNLIKETDPLSIDMSLFPVIRNSAGKTLEGRRIAYDPSYILVSKKLLDFFNSKKDEYQLKEFELRNDYSLSALLLKGPQIDFNTNNDIDKQLQKLEVLKKEKLIDGFYAKSYINVGIGDTVYVR